MQTTDTALANPVLADPVLARYRAAVTELYGDRIERIVLYGSRARGDARPDSDYDIALFLKDLTSRFREGRPIADIELSIMEETGAFVVTLIFPAGRWNDRASPLMSEIRKDGIDLISAGSRRCRGPAN